MPAMNDLPSNGKFTSPSLSVFRRSFSLPSLSTECLTAAQRYQCVWVRAFKRMCMSYGPFGLSLFAVIRHSHTIFLSSHFSCTFYIAYELRIVWQHTQYTKVFLCTYWHIASGRRTICEEFTGPVGFAEQIITIQIEQRSGIAAVVVADDKETIYTFFCFDLLFRKVTKHLRTQRMGQ